MIVEHEANAALAHFETALMTNPNVQYVGVTRQSTMNGKEEWVIEVGVLVFEVTSIPTSLPVPRIDGTLSSRRIQIVVVPSDKIDAN